MTLPQFSLGALVLFPLLMAAFTVLLPAWGRRITGVVTAVGVLLLTLPVVATVTGGGLLELSLGGYDAPLGITLRADGLSVLFLLLTTVVGGLVSVYAALVPASTGQRLVAADSAGEVLEWRSGHPAYWPLWLGCWAGLNAVFVSGDLFNTYVGLELVALTAVGLVALGGSDAWRAALRYLFIAVLGAMLFLVGVGLLVAATGTLDIQQAARVIGQEPGTHPSVVLALVLITVGLMMKVALVPVHGWLIPAHSGAPGAVSPLLSALVIKTSFFVLLRCWLWVAGPGMIPTLVDGSEPADEAWLTVLTVLSGLGWLLGGLGLVAIVLGSVLALRQSRLKPLVAYSTVAQAGYWFLFFPILLDPGSELLEEQAVTTLADGAVVGGAVTGTLGLLLGHGVAKAALFLVAGHLKLIYGTDELARLRGAGQRDPMLIMAMGLAVVGLAGLPFSLAFSGKWELATAAVAAGHFWIVLAVVAATLLSAAYLVKALAPLLVAETEEGDMIRPGGLPRGKVSFAAQVVPFTLGTLTILTGFTGFWVSGVLEVGAPW